MDITFLIGNGFDLALGLKTQYTDFYQYYINETDDKQNIQEFKKNIKDNIETWADAELALGQYTQHFSVDSINQFNNCCSNFSINLIEYLKLQETKIFNITEKTNMSNEIKKGMQKFILLLPTLLRKESTNQISGLIKNTPENHRYQFLNFNYTSCFDRCLNSLGPKGQVVTSHNCHDTQYTSFIGDLVHIHGTLTEDMILGVNDETQIANQDFLKIGLLKRSLIKPINNEDIGLERDKQGSQMIYSSRIICIFGMSLGRTDTIWWERISKWLQLNNMNQLIIMDYCPEFQPVLSTNYIREKEKIQNLFLSYCNFKEEIKQNLIKRIHIAVNVPLFDAKLIEKSENANTEVA